MKTLSYQCAMESEDCGSCDTYGCTHGCHGPQPSITYMEVIRRHERWERIVRKPEHPKDGVWCHASCGPNVLVGIFNAPKWPKTTATILTNEGDQQVRRRIDLLDWKVRGETGAEHSVRKGHHTVVGPGFGWICEDCSEKG